MPAPSPAYHPTATLSLLHPTPPTPLDLLPSTPHNTYITTPPLLLLSPRPDARNLPKCDYYVTTPSTYPHKTVLSVWTPDRGVFLPGPFPRVVRLKAVAVNRMYEEDPALGVLRRVKDGVTGRGGLNVYRGHPGGWWDGVDGAEAAGMLRWWAGVQEGEKVRREKEEGERAVVERGRMKEAEEARRAEERGAQPMQVPERKYEAMTESLRKSGGTWGPEGKWWRVDGMY